MAPLSCFGGAMRMEAVMNGLKAILAQPWAYRLFTKVVGAGSCRAVYVRDFIRPWAGARVLGIGCDPADITDYLTRSEVQRCDTDLSEAGPGRNSNDSTTTHKVSP